MVTSRWQVAKVETSEYDSLIVGFSDYWYQEDIAELMNLIFSLLADDQCMQVIEHVSGADREYCRFLWQGVEYSINFECYSQSCWFERAAYIADVDFTALEKALTQQPPTQVN